MEDVYTVKVKTKPDTRNVYPSERRYSASTVSGLAWVHIALAATSFLLACLALVNPNSDPKNLEGTDPKTGLKDDLFFGHNSTDFGTDVVNASDFETAGNSTDEAVRSDSNYILVLAPSLVTIFALAAGVTAILASVRWYEDRNIAWLCLMSVLSTIFALTAFIMVLSWLITSQEDLSEFYQDKIPFKDYLVVRTTDVVSKNDSHMIVKNFKTEESHDSSIFTKRVLSINVLIAAFLELLWSLLSLKIAYKGMRNNYKDGDSERRGNCISVVTKIKGNNTKNLPRNGKLLPPKPDMIEYPNSKIKRIFLAQNDNGFYLKNQSSKGKLNTETSSEFYKERMMNFLNRCASLEGISNPEVLPSEDPETTINLNPIPEAIANVEINTNPEPETPTNTLSRMTPVSWGDTPEHTIYNQNTLNLESIFKSVRKSKDGVQKDTLDGANAIQNAIQIDESQEK